MFSNLDKLLDKAISELDSEIQDIVYVYSKEEFEELEDRYKDKNYIVIRAFNE